MKTVVCASWGATRPALRPDCPPWCTTHLCDDEAAGPRHARVVQVGQVHVELEWDPEAVDGKGRLRGPVIHVDRSRLSGDDARDFARAILDAVDLAEGGETVKQAIGASVNAAMTERGLTVAELGHRAEISAGRLWRRLQGIASFTAEEVLRIARALDVEVGALLVS